MNNDYKRLLAVNRYRELSLSNAELYNITALAAEICEARIAIISLIHDNVETFLAAKGTDKQHIEFAESFCNSDFLDEAVLAIPDVSNHKRYANTDLATVAEEMRFYAGAKLTSPTGYVVGRLYVLDEKPKQLTKAQESCLQMLATQVIYCLEKEISLKTTQQQLGRLISQQVRQPEALY